MEKKKKETEDLKKEANAAALSTADHHDSRLDAPSLSYACALVYVSFPTTFLLIRDFLIARFFVFFREPRRGQTHPIPTPFPFVHLVTCEKRGDGRGGVPGLYRSKRERGEKEGGGKKRVKTAGMMLLGPSCPSSPYKHEDMARIVFSPSSPFSSQF